MHEAGVVGVGVSGDVGPGETWVDTTPVWAGVEVRRGVGRIAGAELLILEFDISGGSM